MCLIKDIANNIVDKNSPNQTIQFNIFIIFLFLDIILISNRIIDSLY